METMSNYPMNVTDCYECGYFLKGGHFTCQKFPHPHNVEHPTDDPNARYFNMHYRFPTKMRLAQSA